MNRRQATITAFREAIATHFRSRLAVGSALVSWVGLYFIVKEFTPKELQSKYPLLTGAVFLGITAVVLFLGLWSFAMEQHKLAAAAPFLGSPRVEQERAFGPLARLYGYHFDLFKKETTIYAGGIGSAGGNATNRHCLVIVCTTRRLDQWTRSTQSTAAQPSGETNIIDIEPHAITTQLETEVLEDRLIERVHFNPYLPLETPVTIKYERESPDGTFRTRILDDDDGDKRDTDYLGFSPVEPVRQVDLTVHFEGVPISRVWAVAVYGAAAIELKRESLEVAERLSWQRHGSHHTVSFNLPYPILGVSYRLYWRLSGSSEGPETKAQRTEGLSHGSGGDSVSQS